MAESGTKRWPMKRSPLVVASTGIVSAITMPTMAGGRSAAMAVRNCANFASSSSILGSGEVP